MDVVKSNIEKIGGQVDIVNRVGAGATVRLKIPLTLAIIPGLMVESAGNRFVIPQVSLLELIRLDGPGQIETIQGTRVYRRRGSLLPVVPLAEVLGLPGGLQRQEGSVNLIVLQSEDRVFGLLADKIHDTQEIVVKPLSQRIKGLAVYAGATIMGDGRVALILDVTGLGHRAGLLKGAAHQGRIEARPGAETKGAGAQRWLILRVGESERLAIPISMVSRLEEIQRDRIERAGGRTVLQYRGRLLPLVSLGELMGVSFGAGVGAGTSVAPTVVFQDGRRWVGLIVDEIVDVVEENVTVRQKHARPYLLGSAVIGGQVTDLVDVRMVLEAASQGWQETAESAGGVPAQTARVLVAEPSALDRGLVRGCLEMAGYEVCEAGTVPEMLRLLDQRRIDLLVASPAMAAERPDGPPVLPLTADLIQLGDAMLGPVEELLRGQLTAQ
jgi:two-component system chemotaxis sensor kinase CheA